MGASCRWHPGRPLRRFDHDGVAAAETRRNGIITPDMVHPLKEQVRAVRRRARRLVLVRGLGWWSALALLAAFLVGLADYVFRFQEDGSRALAFVAVVSFLSVTFWRIVLPILRRRSSDLQVAQLIERRFPQLQDRLSSSLAFLGDPPGKAAMGSLALQESVIAETDRLVSTLALGG